MSLDLAVRGVEVSRIAEECAELDVGALEVGLHRRRVGAGIDHQIAGYRAAADQ
jgi:hypothetical protein